MQSLLSSPDLSARIADVQALGRALDFLRLDVIGIGGRLGEIALDTRWKSTAMAGYERSVEVLQNDIGGFSLRLAAACEQLRGLVDEMVVAELMRSAQPGTPVAR